MISVKRKPGQIASRCGRRDPLGVRAARAPSTLAARAEHQLHAGKITGQVNAAGVIVAPVVVGLETHVAGVSQLPSAGDVSTQRQ